MINIKQEVYNLLKAVIDLNDTPLVVQKNPTYPYAMLRTLRQNKRNFKNFFENTWLLRVDIFSTYKGDKEISDLYTQIEQKMLDYRNNSQKILDVQTELLILDDKEQGPVTKHGVISITIKTQEV